MPELSSVQIVNPVPGGARVLSYRHARRYVRQGRAEWVKGQPAIRFLDNEHRHQSAQRLARQQTAAGYDSGAAHMAVLKEIQRLPVAFDPVRLIVKRTRWRIATA